MFNHTTLELARDTILDLVRVLNVEIAADKDAGIPDKENDHVALMKAAKNTLKLINNDMENTISIVWSVDDVKKCRPDLTYNQRRDVLCHIEDNQDAGEGVTWDTIEGECEVLYPQKPTKLYLTEEG